MFLKGAWFYQALFVSSIIIKFLTPKPNQYGDNNFYFSSKWVYYVKHNFNLFKL